jgi:hypothetical protein
MPETWLHLAEMPDAAPSVDGCADGLETAGRWVPLRVRVHWGPDR